jgi:glycosyltransferase 2 family protein
VRELIKDRLVFSIKYLVGLVLLGWVLYKVDRQKVIEVLFDLQVQTILVVLILAILNVSIQFRLWKYLIESHSHHYRIKDLLPSFFAGFALRMMIPGGHAEVTKIFLLQGKKRGKVIAFGVEKGFQTALKVVLISFALPIVFPEYSLVLWTLGSLIIIGFFILPIFLKRESFQKHQEKEVSYNTIFFTSLVHSLPIFACITLQYYFLLNQSFDVSMYQTGIVTVFIWGAGLIPISISGLGVRENLAVFFLAQYSVPGAAAVGVSLLVFFINAIIPAIVGIFTIMKRRHDIKEASGEIKRITKSVYKKGKERFNGNKDRDPKSVGRDA